MMGKDTNVPVHSWHLNLDRLGTPGRSSRDRMRWCLAAAVCQFFLGLSVCLVGCSPTQPKEQSEPASEKGSNSRGKDPGSSITAKVQFRVMPLDNAEVRYDNGEESDQYTIVESLGGGVAAVDFDGDGRSDLYFPGGGTIRFGEPLAGLPCKLLRNLISGFQDVSAASFADNFLFYSHGVSFADTNSDGFPDLLITGYQGMQLLLNNGDGTFSDGGDATAFGGIQWASSSGWGDFDNDGLVDLYVSQYVDWSWSKHPRCGAGGKDNRDVCSPQAFTGLDDLLFWNNGDGTFTRQKEKSGLIKEGKGLGVIVFDANYDSKVDIYVANDTTNNFLYMNNGDRTFRESGVLSGTAFDNMGVPNGSMGLAIFDHDDDQKQDLFVTNFERESFAVYRNDGRANFRHVSDKTGINALGELLVGFGTVSGDFTLSGREDIAVANGHVFRFPPNGNRKQEPLYIQNGTDRKLRRIMFEPESFFSSKVCSRGVIAPDLNSDGKLDLVFSNVNEPAVLLENTTATEGNWIALHLVGTRSNRDAIGALVELETDKRKMVRQVIGGGSYLSQGPYQLHFGIPKGDTVKRLQLTWPTGQRKTIDISEVGREYLFVESNG